MISLSRLQIEQNLWQKKNFPDAKSYQALIGISEEVGELCHAHLKDEQGIRTTENHREAKIDAVGDILIYVAAYCNLEGINLHEALADTWEQVQKRDWTKHKKDGVE